VRLKSELLFLFCDRASISFFLIADIESPRRGVIHIHRKNLESLAESAEGPIGAWSCASARLRVRYGKRCRRTPFSRASLSHRDECPGGVDDGSVFQFSGDPGCTTARRDSERGCAPLETPLRSGRFTPPVGITEFSRGPFSALMYFGHRHSSRKKL